MHRINFDPEPTAVASYGRGRQSSDPGAKSTGPRREMLQMVPMSCSICSLRFNLRGRLQLDLPVRVLPQFRLSLWLWFPIISDQFLSERRDSDCSFLFAMPPSTPPPTGQPRESVSTPLNHGSASFAASGGFDTRATYALFLPFFLLEGLTEHPQTLDSRTVDSTRHGEATIH